MAWEETAAESQREFVVGGYSPGNCCPSGNAAGTGVFRPGLPTVPLVHNRWTFDYPARCPSANPRPAASALSSGRVLNAIAALGAAKELGKPAVMAYPVGALARVSTFLPDSPYAAECLVMPYKVPYEGLKAFMLHCSKKIGDAYFRTPRNTITAFVNLLAVLEQNPEVSWQQLLDQVEVLPDTNPDLQPLETEEEESEQPTLDAAAKAGDDDLASFKL